jgi:hypothetical protein
MVEMRKGECEVRRVAAVLGVPLIGPGDKPMGRASLNGGVESSSLPLVLNFKGERK